MHKTLGNKWVKIRKIAQTTSSDLGTASLDLGTANLDLGKEKVRDPMVTNQNPNNSSQIKFHNYPQTVTEHITIKKKVKNYLKTLEDVAFRASLIDEG